MGLYALLSVCIVSLNERNTALKTIEYQRYQMISKADELRQSSDDLTRYARTYVVTLDKKYKSNFFTILDIRNGAAKRPTNYAGIYWDLLEPLRTLRHPLDGLISLQNEMRKLPYSEFEFKKLQQAEFNSNDLVNLEVEAFNAVDGLFKDAEGRYTIKSEPDQQHAIQLLHSTQYHQAKEKIMYPIDEFLSSLAVRTQNTVDETNQEIDDLFRYIFIILAIGLFVFFLVFVMIINKVLKPINRLTQAILLFQQGEKQIDEPLCNDDEIGLMTKLFFIMKRKQDEDYETIKKLALTDPLTKISNRRSFFDISEQILKLSRRLHSPLTLMIMDIDLFKKVNDSYGHDIGDEILVHLVRVVESHLRESDIFARYGGEEFIALLPKTNLAGGMKIAEIIRAQIEQSPYVNIEQSLSVKVTISIGLACFTEDNAIQKVIKQADNALYQAKEKGRNRVEKSIDL